MCIWSSGGVASRSTEDAEDTEGTVTDTNELWSVVDDGNTLIVVFYTYYPTEDHPRLIQECCQDASIHTQATVVTRTSMAAKLPSDFALVKAAPVEDIEKDVIAPMRRCSHVKGVSRQKILTRALKSVARERNVDPGQEQKSEAGKEGKEGKEDKENASTKRREHAHTHKTHEAAGVDTSAGGEVAGVDTSAGGEVEDERSWWSMLGDGAPTSYKPGHASGHRRQTQGWFDGGENAGENAGNASAGMDAGADADSTPAHYHFHRKLLRAGQLLEGGVTDAMGAKPVWDSGHLGTGIKVAIFDTGLRGDHPHFEHIDERINWTDEEGTDDLVGHGSFVAGVVASTDKRCRGFAPDAHLHIFKVFTSEQTSYTSWFLDAFNYAIHTKVDIVNLSVGGPDFLDTPFVDKVNELTANGVIMISAIGNDGPVFGTLNNPADQSNVLGVGAINYQDQVISFSSRGMTTWELPAGYGRFKPDIVSYGWKVRGSDKGYGCRSLSGTSVASPVATGAATLLASIIRPEMRHLHLNPASLKQALVETATKIDVPIHNQHEMPNIFEQGHGKINLTAASQFLQAYTPKASVIPAVFDTTDCPYMWPFCEQELYEGSKAMVANFTIVNAMGVLGWLEGPPRWIPSTKSDPHCIRVSTTYSAVNACI